MCPPTSGSKSFPAAAFPVDILDPARSAKKPGRPPLNRFVQSSPSKVASSRSTQSLKSGQQARKRDSSAESASPDESTDNDIPTPTPQAPHAVVNPSTPSQQSTHADPGKSISHSEPDSNVKQKSHLTASLDPESREIERWIANRQQQAEDRIFAHLHHDPGAATAQVVRQPWEIDDDGHNTPGLKIAAGNLRALRKVCSPRHGYVTTEIELSELIRLFDSQKHDYNVHSHTMSHKASIHWTSDPGIHPSEIQSRSFKIKVSDSSKSVQSSAVIYRWVGQCNGLCTGSPDEDGPSSVPATPQHSNRSTVDSALFALLASRTRSARDRGVRSPSPAFDDDDEEDHHACDARLVVQITANQARAGTCSITMKDASSHPPCPAPKRLRMSRYLRAILQNVASGFGMTTSRLKEFSTDTMFKINRHAKWVLDRCDFRRPLDADYESITRTAAKRIRFDKDPLAAIEIMAARNPDSFLSYSFKPMLRDEPDGKKSNVDDIDMGFHCILATPYTLALGMILVSTYGMYMDSSWRNKNAHRCPLSMLVTINRWHRMVPLAAMISDNATEEVYATFLAEYKAAIVRLAEKIEQDPIAAEIEGLSKAEVIHAARTILNQGFQPAFMMIDGDDAERRGIQRVFPSAPIRACQFHVMQSCRSKARRIFEGYSQPELRGARFMEAFRRCQRCPSEDDWHRYHEAFKEEVLEIAEGNDNTWRQIDSWLKRSWFAGRWRKYVCDYGLPPGVTRDGPWSTNNYSEACFRVFDRVFLHSRSNKRMDRLIAILLHSYFPYYQLCPPQVSRPSRDLVNRLNLGLSLWETDSIRPLPIKSAPEYAESRLLFMALPPVDLGNDRQVTTPTPSRREDSPWHVCGLDRNDREFCNCTGFTATGKRCSHLWAMATFRLCGPVQEFDSKLAVIQTGLHKRKMPPSINLPEEDFQRLHPSLQMNDDENYQLWWGEHPFDSQTDRSVVPLNGPHTREGVIDIVKTALSETDPAEAQYTGFLREVTPITRRCQFKGDSHDNFLDVDAVPPVDTCEHPVPQPTVFDADDPELPHMPSIDVTVPVNYSGPLPKTKPLHPARSRKHQPSSLRPKLTKKTKEGFPVGVPNPQKVDCYVSSLFHMLTKDEYWLNTFETAATTSSLQGDVIRCCVEEFLENARSTHPQALLHFRRLLHDKGLIESASAMDDPWTLFNNLQDYFDNKIGRRTFRSLFEFQLVARVTCRFCGITQPVPSRSDSHTVLFVHPLLNPSQKHNGNLGNLLRDAMNLNDEGDLECSACHTPQRLPISRHVSSISPLLAVSVVWGLVPNGDAVSAGAVIADQFVPAPLDLALDHRHLHLPSGQKKADYVYDLSAIICHIGHTPQSGHYQVITRVKKDWWLFDDDRVSRVFNPERDANIQGRHPVFLLYKRRAAGALLKNVAAVDGSANTPCDPRAEERAKSGMEVSGARHRVKEPTVAAGVPVERAATSAADRLSGPNDFFDFNAYDDSDMISNGTGTRTDASAWLGDLPWDDLLGPEPTIDNFVGNSTYTGQLADGTGVVETQRPAVEPIGYSIGAIESSIGTIGGLIQENGSPIQENRSTDGINWDGIEFLDSSDDATLPPGQIDPFLFTPLRPAKHDRVQYSPDSPLAPLPGLLGKRMDAPTHLPPDSPPDSPSTSSSASSTEIVVLPPAPTTAPLGSSDSRGKIRQATLSETFKASQVKGKQSATPSGTFPSNRESERNPSNWADIIAARLNKGPWRPCPPSYEHSARGPEGFDGLMPEFPAESISALLGALSSPIATTCGDEVAPKDVRGMNSPDKWWSTSILDALGQIGETEATRPTGVDRAFPYPVKYTPFLIRWNDSTQEPLLNDDHSSRSAISTGRSQSTSPPWPSLGEDTQWRKRITVGVVSLDYGEHFGCIVIHGPLRMVLVYDGLAGLFDHRRLRASWGTLLRPRMQWELEQGWVTAADNEGWVHALNNRSNLDTMGWIRQADGSNCGPFAIVVALLVMKGYRPTAAALGLPPTRLSPTLAGGLLLRRTLLSTFLLNAVDAINRARSSGIKVIPPWIQIGGGRWAIELLEWNRQLAARAIEPSSCGSTRPRKRKKAKRLKTDDVA